MTRLAEIIDEADLVGVPSEVQLGVDVTGITDDSRQVRPGDAFVAVAGTASDGHDHAEGAVAAGAAVVLAERPLTALSAPVLVIDSLKTRRSELASRFFGNPSADMTCVGVTGTNGKTSIACFIAELVVGLGGAAAYMGTIGWGRPGALSPSALTTESAILIQERLASFRDGGIGWAVLEVSSHALDQHRVDGVGFDYAVFSNLSRDHLDYHGDFEGYGRAKARLFRFPTLKAAVINVDDPFGRRLARELGDSVEVIRYGETDAEIRWSRLEFHPDGVRGRIHTPWGDGALALPLYGSFSVANAAAALGVLCHSGFELAAVLDALETLSPVPGRMEFFPGNPTLLVDYAHTPDALAKMLAALEPHVSGRIICVCGCGGDRDRGKRPLMAEAACRHADVVWLTSDNPRSEPPERIIEDMLPGVPEGADVHVEVDRLKAIRGAVAGAGPTDLVVIAGKGHEDYQEVRGERLPFDDRAIARALTAPDAAASGRN